MGGWYREFTPKVDRLPSRRRYDNHNGNVKVEREDEIHIGFPSGSQVEKCLSSLIARTQNIKNALSVKELGNYVKTHAIEGVP